MVSKLKKFLVVGNLNSFICKEVFPLFKDNKLWAGMTKVHDFVQPDTSLKSFGNIGWYTNMDNPRRHSELELTNIYDQFVYPKYDNYDAIEVSRVKDIPMDYNGIMGVPITFVEKYNPSQFKIVGQASGNSAKNNYGECANYVANPLDRGGAPMLNGKLVFSRILIQSH